VLQYFCCDSVIGNSFEDIGFISFIDDDTMSVVAYDDILYAFVGMLRD